MLGKAIWELWTANMSGVGSTSIILFVELGILDVVQDCEVVLSSPVYRSSVTGGPGIGVNGTVSRYTCLAGDRLQ